MDVDRPLPTPMTPEAKPFWDGCRAEKLMLPRCEDCGHVFFYPRILCPRCHSRRIGWMQASGRGTLHSFEIAHQAFQKAWKIKPPYVLAMVQLEEGPRMMSNLINVEPSPKAIKCDMPVEVVFTKVSDDVSQPSLHLEAISNAVRDAGLEVKDVDGIFTAGQHSPATLGEALGVKPRYVDGTTVGGCSFIIMVGHAVAALHHGLCDVAVVSHGESGRSGTGVTRSRDTALSGQFEFPYGFGGATSYFGMITTRHMHEYGTTLEQWAQVAVSTRKWAALNPKARFHDPITVAEVLNSRPICYPFTI